MTEIDYRAVETPCYVVDLGLLRKNLEILAQVQERAGCKILLALKGFAMWSTFPIIREIEFASTHPAGRSLALGGRLEAVMGSFCS